MNKILFFLPKFVVLILISRLNLQVKKFSLNKAFKLPRTHCVEQACQAKVPSLAHAASEATVPGPLAHAIEEVLSDNKSHYHDYYSIF